jgi:hypothetical protein
MALPVMKPERRRSPRISLAALAYITFESNCGGIVLNLSDEGLCFHTIAPVERNDTIRFWFSTDGRQIEANGQLVWTDETRKTGGLRFNALSTEARQQIRNWIVQSSEPLAAPRQVAPPPPSHRVRPDANQVEKSVVRRSAKPRDWWRSVAALARWGEFSRGLATGILIAVVVAAVFLFNAYKHRIGESLISLGEHFGATPHSQQVSPAPASASPQAAGPAIQQHAEAAPPAPAATPTVGSGSVQAPIQPPTKAAKPAQAKLEPKAVAPAISLTPSTEALPPIDFAVAPPAAAPAEAAGTVQPESAGPSAGKATVMAVKPASNSSESAEDIAEVNSGVPFGRYFDVGKFKDESGARNTTDDLAHLGVHAIVIPKHRLWMNSYQVIAGPYRDTQEMQVAGGSLRSHGFKTHSLPTRSRGLTLVSKMPVHSFTEVPAENLVVNWETYSPEVTVSFVKAGDKVAKAEGKWVKRPIPYGYDAIVYKQNGNGSRTLLEIWFRGMNRAVILPTTSPNHSLTF